MLLLNLYNPYYWYNLFSQNLSENVDTSESEVESLFQDDIEDPQDFDSDDDGLE